MRPTSAICRPRQFAYDVPKYGDARGVFVEMLKTQDSGQFSFFTAHPGVTRGGHYHHSKTEKFLVIKGPARFGFRHIVSDETCEIFTSGDEPQMVETFPAGRTTSPMSATTKWSSCCGRTRFSTAARPDTIASKV